MKHRGVVIALLLAACERADRAPATPTVDAGPWTLRAVVNEEERDVRACGAACRSSQRAACARGGGKAWKVEYVMGGTKIGVAVTDTGMAAVDFGDRHLVGVDSSLWLACLPACGDPPACVPYIFPVTLGFESDGTCEVTEVDGPAWRGHASRTVTHRCRDMSIHFTVVPALAEIQEALRTVGIANGVRFGGLVVEGRLGDEEPFARLGEVAPTDCSAFDLPADARVRESEDDYRAVIAAQPGLQATMLAKATGTQQDLEAIEAAIRARMIEKGGELTEAELTEVLTEMGAAAGGRADETERLMREEIDRPICASVGLTP